MVRTYVYILLYDGSFKDILSIYQPLQPTSKSPNPHTTTVEPLNKGHYGANDFVPCREVIPFSEVK